MLDLLLKQFQRCFSSQSEIEFISEDIKKLASNLPPLAGILEYHIGNPNYRTDLGLRTTNSDGGREVLAGTHNYWKLTDCFQKEENFKNIKAFARIWANPKKKIAQAVENFWLEFDMIGSAGDSIVPSLFFDIYRDQKNNPEEKIELLKEVLVALKYPIHFQIIQKLKELLRLAPSNFVLYYAGLMLSRKTDALRICIAGVKKDQIIPFLKTIGWQGNFDALQEMFFLIRNSEKLILDLDIGLKIGSKIGIECFPKDYTNWKDFLGHLSKHGFCAEKEKQALLGWPDYYFLSNEEFNNYFSSFLPNQISVLIKRLNHIKLVCHPSGEIKIKAYLYFASC